MAREHEGGKVHLIVLYVLVAIGVIFEGLGDTFLKSSDGLTRLRPVILCLLCFAVSFAMGAYLLQKMPMGVMYAVWCGLGVVIVSLFGYAFHKQALDLPAIIGLVLIAGGIAVISLLSKSVTLE